MGSSALNRLRVAVLAILLAGAGWIGSGCEPGTPVTSQPPAVDATVDPMFTPPKHEPSAAVPTPPAATPTPPTAAPTPPAVEPAQSLIDRLADADPAARLAAYLALDTRAADLLPDLRRNLTHAQPTVRAAVQQLLFAASLPQHRADDPRAVITTDAGTITIELFEDVAPNTVGNFIHLADKQVYDKGVFHRVEDWVVQGGDPDGRGTGGPGYDFDNEINFDSLKLPATVQAQLKQRGFASTPDLKSLSNVRGAVSMAHAGPGTNGSQFFIVRGQADAQWLDGMHTVFGRVIAGMEVVNGFRNGARPKILSIRIENKRPHAYLDGAHGPWRESTAAPPTPTTPPAPAQR